MVQKNVSKMKPLLGDTGCWFILPFAPLKGLILIGFYESQPQARLKFFQANEVSFKGCGVVAWWLFLEGGI